ncbi:MAG: carboxylesterase family protein [Polyangiaceae bacterium]|nr:carboxylesterase family protein [Polyangiaceae bacterium]
MNTSPSRSGRYVIAGIMIGAIGLVAGVSTGCGSEASIDFASDGGAEASPTVDASDAGTIVTDASTSNTSPRKTCTVTPSSEANVIATDRGLVRGAETNNVERFLGIPFAKPPVGALRFHAPVDNDCETTVRDATKYASACLQQGGASTYGNEDCLYLNVWTPKGGAAKKPVLFFIHGGAEVAGSANETANGLLAGNLYDGQKFAETRDVVVVSTNYRLGALGFLAHPALDAENAEERSAAAKAAGGMYNGTGTSGNYAMRDLIMALQWTKANVGSFRGDPTRVMIFGESAGAVNTCALMASPLAKGLFSSALMQSGGCTQPTMAEREKPGVEFATSKKCEGSNTVACLRSLPPSDLVSSALAAVSYLKPMDIKTMWHMTYGPNVDGEVLRDQPIDAFKKGDYNKVPFTIGSNAHETELFLPAVINTCIDYWSDVTLKFGQFKANQVFEKYPCLSYVLPRYATVEWTTDAMFTCEARRIARAVSKSQAEPVRRYQYTHIPSGISGLLRAAHATELTFLFGTKSSPTEGEKKMISNMQALWSQFAASGNPNGGGLVSWPVYASPADEVLMIDEELSVRAKVKESECDFWDNF